MRDKIILEKDGLRQVRPMIRCQAAFWQMEGAELYFRYSSIETDYLKSKDKILSEVIDKIGHIEREIDTDLFSSVIHHIIGQQISTKAQATI